MAKRGLKLTATDTDSNYQSEVTRINKHLALEEAVESLARVLGDPDEFQHKLRQQKARYHEAKKLRDEVAEILDYRW